MDNQGGDTRREEVLSKVLVDISIHTTSHASDTAQNKLCSFWMGPVLLWTVIHEKKDDLTVLDRSSLLQKGNLAMSKTLQRLLEAWPCAYGGASGADADIGAWSQPTRPVVFVSRQFSCQLLCPFSGKYVRECLGKIGDLSVEFPSRKRITMEIF